MVTRLQPADLDTEAIEWARQQPPGEKLVAGPDLFDLSCEFMKAGIRREFPHLGEDAISEVLRARLDDARQQSNRPYSEDD